MIPIGSNVNYEGMARKIPLVKNAVKSRLCGHAEKFFKKI